MNQFFDVLLDSLIDTAKLLPILFVVYLIIEFLEYKNVLEFEKSNLLKGNSGPLVGACFGTVPQCGFSVISAELYSSGKMSMATLIAVFIANSDEALPIMIANYKAIPALCILLSAKFVFALLVGYIIMFLTKNYCKPNTFQTKTEHSDEHLHACCHHDIENQKKFNFLHPTIHCLKISLYIFVVNVIIGSLVSFIGINNIENFLSSCYALQPLFALLVGLIPNCASSVILTEMYVQGIISFGAIITGLCINAGIGFLVLFKENKNFKNNFIIVSTLVVASLVFGYALHFLPLNFLQI